MFKKSYIFCIALLALLFTGIYYAGSNFIGSYQKTNNKEVDVKPENQETASVVNGYWLKSDGRHIIIYNHEGNVLSNTEIPVEQFSERDKLLLNQGIYIESAQELFRYLESYTS